LTLLRRNIIIHSEIIALHQKGTTLMAIQATIDQLKAQAQDFGAQLQKQALEFQAELTKQAELATNAGGAAAKAAAKGGEIVKASAAELAALEVAALQKGYENILAQLQNVKSIKDVETLKAVLQAQIENLQTAATAYASDAAKGRDIVSKAGADLAKLVADVNSVLKGKKAPAKKAAAKKPAAAKAPAKAAATPAAAKKAPAKKPAAKKTTTTKAAAE
jgi:hypothetical protein